MWSPLVIGTMPAKLTLASSSPVAKLTTDGLAVLLGVVDLDRRVGLERLPPGRVAVQHEESVVECRDVSAASRSGRGRPAGEVTKPASVGARVAADTVLARIEPDGGAD